MSTTAPPAKPAPWSQSFQDHISHLPSPEFVLATLHPAPTPDPKTSTSTSSTSAEPPTAPHGPTPAGLVPRARYCIYRGMFAALPTNSKNPAPLNPSGIYTSSDLLTFTTDVRMQKVGELFSTSQGHATSAAQVQGSGGGGAVEAVFWVSELGKQWRIRGTGWVIAPDIENQRGDVKGEVSSGVRSVKSVVGKRMEVLDAGREKEWSWGRELTAHFGNVSPGMRGTWRNPPPGTPTGGQEPPKGMELGQKVEDMEDELARENFRVVVIVPEEVEQVDIKDPATARRWLYTHHGDTGDWKTEELWP